mmetsp:Transcript_17534/g.41615  ORF Transcript_17534/g.41615 Transcript_17534/m.41615 type:complete len:239 (-) Transcript_17534:885-1601(-)
MRAPRCCARTSAPWRGGAPSRGFRRRRYRAGSSAAPCCAAWARCAGCSRPQPLSPAAPAAAAAAPALSARALPAALCARRTRHAQALSSWRVASARPCCPACRYAPPPWRGCREGRPCRSRRTGLGTRAAVSRCPRGCRVRWRLARRSPPPLPRRRRRHRDCHRWDCHRHHRRRRRHTRHRRRRRNGRGPAASQRAAARPCVAAPPFAAASAARSAATPSPARTPSAWSGSVPGSSKR